MQKASVLHRIIAKAIDLLIVMAIYEIPLRVGFWGGLFYLCLADGFSGGRSIGKRMIGLRVAVRCGSQSASFRETLLRNVPFGLAYFIFHIPWIGWLLVLMMGGIELLLMIGNANGLRIGDEMADTQVLDDVMKQTGNDSGHSPFGP